MPMSVFQDELQYPEFEGVQQILYNSDIQPQLFLNTATGMTRLVHLNSPSPSVSPTSPVTAASFPPTPTDNTEFSLGTHSSIIPSRGQINDLVPRRRGANRVPRPRNAFMIFRSEFWAGEKITRSVERDHRHISRIVAHCWNQMSESDKDVWRHKAAQEKLEHIRRYPDYRFSPGPRAKKPVKRNVKRNGADELLRCRQVAELLLNGKQGIELADAVKSMKLSNEEPEKKIDGHKQASMPNSTGQDFSDESPQIVSVGIEAAPFRSPLLPPLDVGNCIAPSRTFLHQNDSMCPTEAGFQLPNSNSEAYIVPLMEHQSPPTYYPIYGDHSIQDFTSNFNRNLPAYFQPMHRVASRSGIVSGGNIEAVTYPNIVQPFLYDQCTPMPPRLPTPVDPFDRFNWDGRVWSLE